MEKKCIKCGMGYSKHSFDKLWCIKDDDSWDIYNNFTEISLEEMLESLPVGEYYINNPIKNGDMWNIQITGRTFEGSTITEAITKYFNHLQSKKT